jgi:glycosyltransferase involved in cell wall biosynthesis
LKERTVLINGYFLCRRLTGIERYAYEITKRLDALIAKDEVALIVPNNIKNVPEYKNITLIRHKQNAKSHIFWQMVTLQWFLLKNRKYLVLEFGNTCIPFAPGIIFLHDIYCEFFSEDFISIHDKLVRLYNRWQYRLIANKAKAIATVSNFTKNQISQTYHVNPDKIKVIYSSWNHFRDIEADDTIFDDFPVLKSKPFYFSLGSLSKRKNISWIIEYAAKHKDCFFAICGTSLPVFKVSELNDNFQNIVLLGYLNDERVKALMEKCKAFLLPSYYEGFGLTPIEALSCGATVVVAKAASLPEIYGNTAHYIDPFNTNIDLDKLLKESVEKPDAILEKYSYDLAARQTLEIIRSVTVKK